MGYTTVESLRLAIPAGHLAAALDDDGDGQPDEGLMEQLVADASTAVDARLSAHYATPVVDYPPSLAEAALAFACEKVYDRRGVSEDNPFRKAADGWRKTLDDIGSLKVPLMPSSYGGAGIGMHEKHHHASAHDQDGIL